MRPAFARSTVRSCCPASFHLSSGDPWCRWRGGSSPRNRASEQIPRIAASAAPAFEEVDTQAPATPARYRSYASPTILVNGVAIGGGEARHGSCCRLYLDDGGRRLVGVPSEAALRTAVARAARTSRTGAT